MRETNILLKSCDGISSIQFFQFNLEKKEKEKERERGRERER